MAGDATQSAIMIREPCTRHSPRGCPLVVSLGYAARYLPTVWD
jgi:hypothetical protein